MQQRSLTHSRHTSTMNHSRDSGLRPTSRRARRAPALRQGTSRGAIPVTRPNISLITTLIFGLIAVLLTGASSAPAQAVPDVQPAAPPAQITASADSSERAESRSIRKRDAARAGKATARERRHARSAIRQSVADLALRQEGKAYAAGGEGPNAFDCSGFTLFAWQSAGVQLTHYSAGQYQQVKKIPAEAAMPGDLVFYLSRGARHVGMYIGDGQIVHASDYGVGVIVSPVRGTPWTNAHFTGFGRVTIPDAQVRKAVKERRQRR